MVVMMGFVLEKRFRRYRMGCGSRTLGVATGEEAWELYVNMWDMKKGGWQVFGLDSHPFLSGITLGL